MHLAIIIAAAGKGERAGRDTPKQYVPLNGKPLLRRAVEAFSGCPDAAIQVMIGADQEAFYAIAVEGLALRPPAYGGATRQETVRLGLAALADINPDFVLIHDAARPLISRTVIDRVIKALEGGAEVAVPLLPVADTLRKYENGAWITVPRQGLMRAQTPQGFRYATIFAAHRELANEAVTDDMALAELAGLRIAAVPGEETNMKITSADDFAVAERLLAGETRTGSGYDVHRFVPGDHIWLCGVKLAHDHALEGHSDADVGLHALTDAILGAIGAGDIGQHFPPSDEKWRGAASAQFLKHAADLLKAEGGAVVHCDVTIICERPKIGPHRDAMRARIADILGIEPARVSVKATTTEGLGFTGRREGLAAEAIATVRLP